MTSKILWNNQIHLRADGYSYAAQELTARLADIGVFTFEDVDHNLQTIFQKNNINIGMVHQGVPDIDYDILVNNVLPVDYAKTNKYNIGFSYWETTALPDSWVPKLNECNEVWTTSKWAVDVFKNSGVDVPIYGFDLGVDTDTFKYMDNLRSMNPFTFLHVGSPSKRKNTQLVVDAFLKLYKNNPDYCLIVKSSGPPDARIWEGQSIISSIYEIQNINVIDHYLSNSFLAQLFGRVNCLVYPTMGEGWGMIPFQSIACGVPTICTNATACTEFAELSVPLEADMADSNLFGIYSKGYWANPKIDDVCDKMLYVVNNYDEVLKKTLDGSKIIHDNYSWDKVVIPYRERLLEVQNII